METVLVFAMGKYFDIPSTALVYIANNFIEGVSMLDAEYQNSHNAQRTTIEMQYQAGLKLLFSL